MKKDIYDYSNSIEDFQWWCVVRREICYNVLSKYVQPSTLNNSRAQNDWSILDIGCGNGGNLPLLEQFGTTVGVEMDEGAVENYKKRFPDKPVFQGFLPERIPEEITSKRYNIITMLDVLEHIEEDEQSLEKVKNLLKSDGILFITVPAYQWLFSKIDELLMHKRRYNSRSLKKLLLKCGFEIKYITYFNTLLFPIAAMVRILSRFIKEYDAKQETSSIPGFKNNLLKCIFGIEKIFIPYMRLPFGLSLCVVCKK